MLTANAKINVLRNIEEVFDAIINPKHLSQFFISNATGPLENGTTVHWSFPEIDGSFPVIGKEIRPYEYISFDWSGGGENQYVEIKLSRFGTNATTVEVIEHEMEMSEEGVQLLKQQTEGWANFLACLKAYLEYNINLRKGAFDFMKNEHP